MPFQWQAFSYFSGLHCCWVSDKMEGVRMNNLKEKLRRQIYEECEKRWNATHECAWINGNMEERIDLYLQVEAELLNK